MAFSLSRGWDWTVYGIDTWLLLSSLARRNGKMFSACERLCSMAPARVVNFHNFPGHAHWRY